MHTFDQLDAPIIELNWLKEAKSERVFHVHAQKQCSPLDLLNAEKVQKFKQQNGRE